MFVNYKWYLVIMILLLLGMITYSLWGASVYTGTEGYIAVPRIHVAKDGRFNAGIKYTYPSLFTVGLNFVPLSNLELSLAGELQSQVSLPFFAGVKFQLLSFGIGMIAEFPLTALATNYYTFYAGWQEDFIGFNISIALGYTFNRRGNILFLIGFQKLVFPAVYLIGDFSNFPYRYNPTGRGPEFAGYEGGIVNLGVRILLNSFFSFDLCGLDLMDSNRSFMISANVYLNFWGKMNQTNQVLINS